MCKSIVFTAGRILKSNTKRVIDDKHNITLYLCQTFALVIFHTSSTEKRFVCIYGKYVFQIDYGFLFIVKNAHGTHSKLGRCFHPMYVIICRVALYQVWLTHHFYNHLAQTSARLIGKNLSTGSLTHTYSLSLSNFVTNHNNPIKQHLILIQWTINAEQHFFLLALFH